MSFYTCLVITAGGALGTLARYLISLAALPISRDLPWGTIGINPFIDGNKRTAFAVTFTFLAVNDVTITADEDALMRFLMPLYARSAVAFDKLEAWLRKNTRPA